MSNKVLLIDADSLLYFAGYQDSEEEARESLVKRLIEMCNEHDTEQFIGFLSSGSHRYEIAKTKEYKGNRKKSEKPPHYDMLREYATTTLKFEFVEGMEADDLVVYWHYNLGIDNIICSPDKDVLQNVPGEHWDYKYRKIPDTEDVEKGRKVNVSKQDALMFPYKQCIIGDSGDNIPGIPGLGKAKVGKIMAYKDEEGLEELCYKKAIETFVEHFGNPEGFIKFLEMYRLVYILKTPEDVKRELGFELVEPKIRKISY
jgi:hypothetical protein